MKIKIALSCMLCLVLWAGTARTQELDLTPDEKAFIAAHPVITFSDVHRPPLSIVDNGRHEGMLHDYYAQLARLTGLTFRFEPLKEGQDLASALDALTARRIDMLGGSGAIASRSAYAHFVGPVFHLPMAVAALPNETPESLAALDGRTIVVAKDSLAATFLHEEHPNMDVVLAPDARAGLQMVAAGTARAMLGDQGSLSRALREAGNTNLTVTRMAEHVFGVYSLVRKDWPQLASILEKAGAVLPRAEMQAILERWLPEEDVRTGGEGLNLTAEERRYIRDNPVFTASNEQNWPPLNFNTNGLPQGYSVDYLKMLARMAGIKVRFVTGPDWDTFENMLKKGTLDVVMNMAATPSRRAYALFTPTYATLVHGLVYRDSEPAPPTLESLAGRTVAVPKGFFTEQVIRDNYPDIHVLTPPDTLGCLQAVSTGEADAFVGSLPPQSYLIRKHFMLNLQLRALVDNKHFPTVNVRFGVTSRRPLLASILSKAMARVGEKQVSELRRKWLSADSMDRQYIPLTPSEKEMLSQLGEVRMCVHPNWMPFSRIDEQGAFTGMAADYAALMAERIGVNLRLVPTATWNQSLENMAARACDIIPAVTPTEARRDVLSFTRPYLDFPVVAATLQDTVFVPDLAALAGKRIGALGDAAWTASIRDEHPDVTLVEVASVDQGLDMVRDRELFAFVDSSAAISYAIARRHFTDLKIAGTLQESLTLAVGVDKQNPLLGQVFDMAVSSLTEKERRDIFSKWIAISYEHGFDYALFWKILLGVALVLGAVFYWNLKLARLNRAVTQANAGLNRANAKITTLLDNSGQGFLSFGADGVVEPELSRECDRLFGTAASGKSIAALLYPDDAADQETFAKNIVRILGEEDAFKRDLFLSLMPTHFVLGETRVDAAYRLPEAGRMMLVLTDVTGEHALEAEVERERGRLALIVAAVRDAEDFFNVLDDIRLFQRCKVRGETPGEGAKVLEPGWEVADLYRHVHTFKGLLLQLEFIHAPKALHELESALSAWQRQGTQSLDAATLADAWQECGCQEALDEDLALIRTALGEAFFERSHRILVPVELIDCLEQMADRLKSASGECRLGADDRQALEELGRLRLRDMRDMLAAYPKAARALAARTGKEVRPFRVEGDAVLVAPRIHAPLVAALVHVFRNAVVHGIEEPDIRLEAGKPEAGRIACRVEDLGERVRIVIEDDGRGIDLDALRERAESLGLVPTGDAERDLELVFERDLTTHATADSLSGRGIGLFAVKDRLERLGGSVRVTTTPGRGTAFCFTLPKLADQESDA